MNLSPSVHEFKALRDIGRRVAVMSQGVRRVRQPSLMQEDETKRAADDASEKRAPKMGVFS